MKKFWVFLIVSVMLIPSLVMASEMEEEELVTKSIEIGNIMKAGDVISAEGDANGLIMLAGQTITSRASGEYALIAGQDVNLGGNVTKDAFVLGQNITLSQEGIIQRDIYVLGQKVMINGTVNGNVYVLATELIITENAVINGNITSRVGTIKIDGKALINGVVEYHSDTDAIIPSNVQTKVVQVEKGVYTPSVWDKVKDKIYGIVMSIVLFLAMILVVPALFHKMDEKYTKEELGIGKTIGIGAGVLFLVPILSIFLIIFVVGIPAGIVFLLAYVLLIMISFVTASYAISKIIWKNKMNSYLGTIILIIALEIVKIIPIIGGLVSFVVMIFGIGIVMEALRGDKKEEEIKIINE